MLSKDLPQDIQELAYRRHLEDGYSLPYTKEEFLNESLHAMFRFANTPEGHKYWYDVYEGKSPSPPSLLSPPPSCSKSYEVDTLEEIPLSSFFDEFSITDPSLHLLSIKVDLDYSGVHYEGETPTISVIVSYDKKEEE